MGQLSSCPLCRNFRDYLSTGIKSVFFAALPFQITTFQIANYRDTRVSSPKGGRFKKKSVLFRPWRTLLVGIRFARLDLVNQAPVTCVLPMLFLSPARYVPLLSPGVHVCISNTPLFSLRDVGRSSVGLYINQRELAGWPE